MTCNIVVSLFGSFAIHIDGQPIPGVRAAKAQALLAYLALEANRSHSRAALQALFWPELAASGAMNALRVTLHRLRADLDKAVDGVSDQLLTVTRQSVQLNHDAADIDVLNFQSRMSAVAAHGHKTELRCAGCHAHLLAAVNLAQGELLAGLDTQDAAPFDEWLLMQRERLRAHTLAALSQMAENSLQRGDFADAQEYAMRQLMLDPLREPAHRQFLRSLLRRGLIGDAVRHYAQMEQLLKTELGVLPTAETAELLRQIRQGTADLNVTTDPQVTQALSGTINDAPPSAPATPRQFLGDAPLHGPFFGRHHEMSRLRQWLLDEKCRLVTILGLGGMGKSALAARTIALVAEQYDVVIWYSLVNAPELPELLTTMLHMLPETPLPTLPSGIEALLNLFFVYLQEQRVLIVLDNVESILAPEGHGTYRDGHESYAQLFKRIAFREHRGQIFVTSRERPHGFGQLEGDLPWVRSLPLDGMDETAAAELLKTRGIAGTKAERTDLVARYSGNPLALKLVAETIDEVFDGNLNRFLSEEAAVFDDIRRVLDEQFGRVSALEREILYWMALEREPVSVRQLQNDLLHRPSFRQLLEALRHLQRCSLAEPIASSQVGEAQTEKRFGLQNVVLEYLTDQLIEIAVAELQSGDFQILHRHALIKAQSKEYMRRSQIRLLIEPTVRRLESHLTHTNLSTHLLLLVHQLQTQVGRRPSYAGGTILNLMILQKLDLTGLDFSRICLWQVDLQHASLVDASLSEADLTNTSFRQTFGRLETLVASPDGRWLAGGGERGDLRLYPLDESQPIVQLRGHTNTVRALGFSPDGTVLASGGYDHMIKMWHTESGQVWRTITAPSSVLSLAYSPDGSLLATGEYNGDIRIWHAESGNPLAQIRGHTAAVMQIIFHPNGSLVATCGNDGYVRVWHIDSLLKVGSKPTSTTLADASERESLQKSTSLPVHTIRSADGQPFRVLDISCDGRYMAAGTLGGMIMMGDTLGEKPWNILGSHDDALLSLVFHPRRMIVATCGDDATIRLWDASTGECIEILKEHDRPVWSVAFTPDGYTLASTGAEGTVRYWQFASTGQLMPLRTFFGTIKGIDTLAWSQDGRLVATGGLKGTIWVWSVDSPVPQCIHVIQGHAAVHYVAFSPDGRWLATTGIDPQNAIKIWNMESGQLSQTLLGHTAISTCLCYSPDGKLLARGDHAGILQIWDVSQPDEIRLTCFLRGHRSTIIALSFNPVNSTLLASGSKDMTIRMWDTASGQEVATVPGDNFIGVVRFDPTGRYLAIADQHNSIALWDLVNPDQPTRVLVFEGHVDALLSVAFHPDGSQLVSGGLDRMVCLWDTTSGRMIKTLGQHDGYVTSVTFSPDGQFVASTGKDDVARIWSVKNGEHLHTLHTPGPYEGMDITGVTGISEPQRLSLKALGAVEQTATGIENMR